MANCGISFRVKSALSQMEKTHRHRRDGLRDREICEPSRARTQGLPGSNQD